MKTPHPHSLLRLALAAGFALILGSKCAFAGSATWTATSGNWSNSVNWSSSPGGFVPNNGNNSENWNASIGTSLGLGQNVPGAISMDTSVNLNSLSMAAGTLTVSNPLSVGTLSLQRVIAWNNAQYTPIIAGTGTIDVSGGMNWSAGTISGSGAVNVAGALVLDTSNAQVGLTGRTLNTSGGASWTGANFLNINSGGVINNLSGSTWTTNLTSSTRISGSGTFNNQAGATFTKNNSSGLDVYAGFNNSGTANINGGYIQLFASDTHSGTYNIASGAQLVLSEGTHTFTSGAQINAPAGATLQFTANGSHGGTSTFAAPVTIAGNVVLAYGIAAFNNTTTLNTLNMPTYSYAGSDSGGQLNGTGTVTVNGQMTWTSGALAGSGVTNANGGLVMNTSNSSSGATPGISQRTLNNAGTASWTGNNTFGMYGNATINNVSGASFTLNPAFNAVVAGGSGENFNNQSGATLNKEGNSYLQFRPNLNNSGTLGVNGGTLAATTLNMQAGTLSGAGFVSAQTFNWSGGTLQGTGGTSVSGCTITTSGAKGLDRTLNNTGTITYSSPTGSSIQFGVGTSTPGVINNSGTFNVTGNGNFQTTNANAGHAINNSGIWNSTGSGNSTINTGIAFNNTGSVNVSSGRNFVVLGGGTHTGSFSVSSGSTLSLMGGQTNLNSGSSITGAGSVVLGGGPGVTVNTGATYNTTGNTSLSGGNATFNTNATTGTFTGGSEQSHLTVSGATTKLKVNGTFTNNTQYTILQGGAIIETTAFNLNGGELKGNGSINGNVTTSGLSSVIAPGLSPGALTINGSLALSSGNTLAMEIGGLSQGSLYDYLDVNGSLTLAGMLELNFINDFQTGVTSLDQFTLATANTDITGSFLNVASGGRVNVGSFGSFQVWYGAGSAFGAGNLVLGDFTAVPEPSRAILLMFGLFGLMNRRRRK